MILQAHKASAVDSEKTAVTAFGRVDAGQNCPKSRSCPKGGGRLDESADCRGRSKESKRPIQQHFSKTTLAETPFWMRHSYAYFEPRPRSFDSAIIPAGTTFTTNTNLRAILLIRGAIWPPSTWRELLRFTPTVSRR